MLRSLQSKIPLFMAGIQLCIICWKYLQHGDWNGANLSPDLGLLEESFDSQEDFSYKKLFKLCFTILFFRITGIVSNSENLFLIKWYKFIIGILPLNKKLKFLSIFNEFNVSVMTSTFFHKLCLSNHLVLVMLNFGTNSKRKQFRHIRRQDFNTYSQGIRLPRHRTP